MGTVRLGYDAQDEMTIFEYYSSSSEDSFRCEPESMAVDASVISVGAASQSTPGDYSTNFADESMEASSALCRSTCASDISTDPFTDDDSSSDDDAESRASRVRPSSATIPRSVVNVRHAPGRGDGPIKRSYSSKASGSSEALDRRRYPENRRGRPREDGRSARNAKSRRVDCDPPGRASRGDVRRHRVRSSPPGGATRQCVHRQHQPRTRGDAKSRDGRIECARTARPFGLPPLRDRARRDEPATLAVRAGTELLRRLNDDRHTRRVLCTAEYQDPCAMWDRVMARGHAVKASFRDPTLRRQNTLIAGAREAALRSESLIDALASADETLTWLKMHYTDGEAASSRDPIFCTSSAVLDNLRCKLGPVCTCRGHGMSRSLDDMLRRSSPYDMTDPVTFTLIMLTRLSRAVKKLPRQRYVELYAETDPLGALAEYEPGDCSVGILRHLLEHSKRCEEPACTMYIAGILAAPDRPNVKYL